MPVDSMMARRLMKSAPFLRSIKNAFSHRLWNLKQKTIIYLPYKSFSVLIFIFTVAEFPSQDLLFETKMFFVNNDLKVTSQNKWNTLSSHSKL